jgi:IS5 family transposase
VEYVFHVIKNIFGYRKLRYKGLAKNSTKNIMSVTMANLYMLQSAGRKITIVWFLKLVRPKS